jgi:flagellar protein FliO/FliZ
MSSDVSALTIFILVFVLVLGSIAVVFGIRKFGNRGLGQTANRGRLPRLAVVAAESLGGPRQLVLVRRDNVEHLLVIGGSTDVVVEQNIVRAPQREQANQRGALAGDNGRGPTSDTWAEPESRGDMLDPYEAQPAPEPPVLRSPRSSLGDEARRPPPSMPERAPLFPERNPPERNRDPLAGFTPEPPPRQESRQENRAEPRIELPSRPARVERPEPPRESLRPPLRNSEPPMPRPPRMPERTMPAPPQGAPQDGPLSAADQNLAEMAQRLEAALRRPASDSEGAPPVAPDAPAPRAARPAPPPAATPETGEPHPPAKNPFENLEDEMASLLGRAKPPA